ncbi:MAG: DUF3866 family protein [Capsulimonadaceae bacterium]
MLTLASGVVVTARKWGADAQELTVDVDGTPRRALHYLALGAAVVVGERVLLNTTARELGLGTAGYDFVVAKETPPARPKPKTEDSCRAARPGHIVKGRYTPWQHTVLTLEEQPEYADIWKGDLDGMPVLAGQLHSQIIPVAAGLKKAGLERVVYIMTDAAALPLAFSRAVRTAKAAGLIAASITCGQAFGGDHETVTLHSALIAARRLVGAKAAVVCQGPGNAGTGTRYGFGGIEQAGILDAAAALGGYPIAVVRMSCADSRERHRGISHHTLTSLRLVRSRCLVPLPEGQGYAGIPADIADRHDLLRVDASGVVNGLADFLGPPGGPTDECDAPELSGKEVLSTMGRTIETDRVFFLAAAAAGLAAGTRAA